MATRSLVNLLNSVLSRSGFVTESAFVGGDIDAVQMVEFANLAQLEFRNFYPWATLRKTGTLTMAGTASYALASDFHRLVPSSMYQQASDTPVDLPADDILWGYLKSSDSTVAGNRYTGKIIGGAVVFDSENTGDVITYDYISKYAVQATGGGATKERFTVDTDVFLLDEETLLEGITAFWQTEKGIPAAATHMALFRKKMREWISVDTGAKNIIPAQHAGRGGPRSDAIHW